MTSTTEHDTTDRATGDGHATSDAHATSDGQTASDASDGRSSSADNAASESTASAVERAVAAFRAGEPVLIHDADDREGEIDLIYPAGAITTGALARLRNDAGGLVCVALSDSVCEAFSLPFAAEGIDHPATERGELGYDDRASFSLPVNHRDTHTGITDRDRARTITALADAAATPTATDFAAEFRVPGHVHLLRGAPRLVADREGHTELGLALAAAAECPPAVVVCEMLDGAGARSPDSARAYADRHGLVYVEGAEIVDRFGE